MGLVQEKFLKTKAHLGYGHTVWEFKGKRYLTFPHKDGGYGVCLEDEHTSRAKIYKTERDDIAICTHLGLNVDKYQEALWAS